MFDVLFDVVDRVNYVIKKTEAFPYHFALWCLIAAGFAVRLYMAHVDPFLHVWDERFHALVARNMMDAPFRPELRANPVLPPDNFSWTQATIWLHKPPLFMWQMALSLKLFGSTVYALRYPSVIMGTLMIPMVYRITADTMKHKMLALLAAGLFCFSNFHLELVAGIRSMDHNDLCLEFYVLASVWAWIRYEKAKKWYWLVLIGLFAGAAVLTKWLIGLFVYLCWGFRVMFEARRRLELKEAGRFLCSLLICCLVFLPWQFFIRKHYPAEAAFEYEFNRRHITEALEGHEGNSFFYLARFPQLFGEGICWLMVPGLWLCYRYRRRSMHLWGPLLAGSLFAFLFFSLAVKTKVISHLYFIAPFAMMLIACSLLFIAKKWLRKGYLSLLFFSGVFILDAKPEKIVSDQYVHNEQRLKDIQNAHTYVSVGRQLPRDAVVINAPDFISFMFFNKGMVAYESFSEEQLKILADKKVWIYAFCNVPSHPLPACLLHYPFLKLIKQPLL